LLHNTWLNREVLGGIDKNLNKKESQISVIISLEKGNYVIGAVLRDVVLVLIKNLWHVNYPIVPIQQHTFHKEDVQPIFYRAPKCDSFSILVVLKKILRSGCFEPDRTLRDVRIGSVVAIFQIRKVSHECLVGLLHRCQKTVCVIRLMCLNDAHQNN
jgi:hypothetical protein